MSLTKPVGQLVEESSDPLLGIHPSWERVLLSHIAHVLNGFAFPSSSFSAEAGIPLIRIRDILGDHTETRFVGEYDPRYLVQPGELLVGMDGDFNCALWRGEPGLLNQRVCKVSPNDAFYSTRFLAYALPGYLKAINDATSSQTVKHLSSRSVESIPLPLPPLNEQSRISLKIDELFSELELAERQSNEAKAKLPNYWKSLLKAAIDGKLTEEWRNEQIKAGRRAQETGQQLLERIAERKQAEQKRTGLSFEAPSRALTRGDEIAALTALPEGWCWASVEQLAHVQLGRQRTPAKVRGENPTKYIRAANITPYGIDFSDILQMDFSAAELPTYKLHLGDIVLTEASGSPEHVGRPAMWPDVGDEIYCFQNTVIRVRPILVHTAYLFRALQACQQLGRFAAASSGVGINHLGRKALAETMLPLPPLPEQLEIARQLEQQETLVKETATTLAEKDRQNERLRRSILEQAFTGRLVPQDPSDEPAGLLLKRVDSFLPTHRSHSKAEPTAKRRSKQRSAEKIMKDILDALPGDEKPMSAQALLTACGLNDQNSSQEIEKFYLRLRQLLEEGKITVTRKRDEDFIALRA